MCIMHIHATGSCIYVEAYWLCTNSPEMAREVFGQSDELLFQMRNFLSAESVQKGFLEISAPRRVAVIIFESN